MRFLWMLENVKKKKWGKCHSVFEEFKGDRFEHTSSLAYKLVNLLVFEKIPLKIL